MTQEQASHKLESLRRCVLRLEQKRPASLEELRADVDTQDILAVNLERAIQLCVDLAAARVARLNRPAPEGMAQCFELLRQEGLLTDATAERMRRAVGFRNLAVHRYREIDWNIVFALVHRHLEDFAAFAREIGPAWPAEG